MSLSRSFSLWLWASSSEYEEFSTWLFQWSHPTLYPNEQHTGALDKFTLNCVSYFGHSFWFCRTLGQNKPLQTIKTNSIADMGHFLKNWIWHFIHLQRHFEKFIEGQDPGLVAEKPVSHWECISVWYLAPDSSFLLMQTLRDRHKGLLNSDPVTRMRNLNCIPSSQFGLSQPP